MADGRGFDVVIVGRHLRKRHRRTLADWQNSAGIVMRPLG
jgi:hypothetical protein